MQSTMITGATLIDGVVDRPREGLVVWIEGGSIRAIDYPGALPEEAAAATQIDARGKYVVPGIMDANVHLLGAVLMEDLVRYESRFEDLVLEGAQIALKNGITTVFDTWGPRIPLMRVRDRINAGDASGSRIFCAGNIVGLDGPFSHDFFPQSLNVATPALVERVNGLWAENVGPRLTWMTAGEAAAEVRSYIAKGIDFLKYAASEHRPFKPGSTAYLAFSEQAQRRIVEQAHRAGITAQAHTTSVEALRAAIEAEVEIIQHCNITGHTPIPESTLMLLARHKTASTVFPLTRRHRESLQRKGQSHEDGFLSSIAIDVNLRNLIGGGARLLLATDGVLISRDAASDTNWAPVEDNLFELGQGHFHWLTAMEEAGFAPMEALRAATRYVAEAYQKNDLGTLQAGKVADLLVLNKNPLEAARHWRSIEMVMKAGAIVDRDALPSHPVLTCPAPVTSETTLAYRAHRHAARTQFPACCVPH